LRQPGRYPPRQHGSHAPPQAAEVAVVADDGEVQPRATLDRRHERIESGVQLLGGIERWVWFHLREQFPCRGLDHRAAELPLGTEVVEQQPGRHADPLGDRLHAHLLERPRFQHDPRGVEDLAAAIPRRQPATRR
jgi:hypothetical protein